MSLFKDVDLVKEEPVVIVFSVNPDQLSALEITRSFQKIAPHDPVRYDFALTRLGIRKDTDITSFLDEFGRNTGKMREDSPHLWISYD